MKLFKLILSAGILFLCGFALRVHAQVTLPEVKIVAVSYKYLNAVDYTGQPQPVRLLQEKAATFDVKNSENYDDDYAGYFVSFYIPEGKILAAYDRNGKLLRTAEKYNNVKMPVAVSEAIAKRFPQWTVSENIYIVNYYNERNKVNKKYKVLLENGDKRIKIEASENGDLN
ncbi:MAG TPA: hypothetical protein VFE54_12755 [Mucilaginibacter sp.]|jgi:hypothetical protein|nr:hypothetical protein [Mucilaginibacter sp.]